MESRLSRAASLGGGLGVLAGVIAAAWLVVAPERYLQQGLTWSALEVLLGWALAGLPLGLVAGLLSGLPSRRAAAGRKPASGRRPFKRGRRLASLVGLCLMATTLLGSLLLPFVRPRHEGPNLVLISIDTLRADRLGCYGYRAARTPNLDALARDGELWETVIASSPVTLTAMSTLMTGLDPPRHGAHYNGFYELRRDAVTLAELLAERGYATGAVVGNFALDRRFRIAQGFQSYDDRMTRTMSPEPPEHSQGDSDEGTWWSRHLTTQPAQRFADEVTSAGIAWLEDAGDGPFFLWVHYMDPHGPYLPPEGFRSRDPYDGEVAFVDDQVGRLLAEYRARFGDQDTLFVVVADHGESLGEHGLTGHVFAVYEEMLRVPFFMKREGRLGRGVRHAEPLRGRDVSGEILRALDLEDPAPIASGSPPDGAPWWAYSETYQPLIARRGEPIRSLRGTRWKYVQGADATSELFDLEADPNELKNVLAAQPEEADALRALLMLQAGETSAIPGDIDEETRARLRALGYIDEE